MAISGAVIHLGGSNLVEIHNFGFRVLLAGPLQNLATRDEFMCITFAVTFAVTFRVTFGVTIFGFFLQNGYNLVTRPPIEILRPLFTLQLLILPTRDSFHAQKS